MLSLEGSCCTAVSSAAAGSLWADGHFPWGRKGGRSPQALGHENFALSVILAQDGCHRKPRVLLCVHLCGGGCGEVCAVSACQTLCSLRPLPPLNLPLCPVRPWHTGRAHCTCVLGHPAPGPEGDLLPPAPGCARSSEGRSGGLTASDSTVWPTLGFHVPRVGSGHKNGCGCALTTSAGSSAGTGCIHGMGHPLQ